eukprot:Hpha_TRINITY_DN19036_c0_g1::TRINITY_DN19036_c0_g1_i1::g.138340::m.138340
MADPELRANIFYLNDGLKDKKELITYDKGRRDGMLQQKQVPILDARSVYGKATEEATSSAQIRGKGFSLVPFTTFQDLSKIENTDMYRTDGKTAGEESLHTKRLYFQEVEGMLKRVTGASYAFVFDHAVRSGHKNSAGVNYLTQYAQFAHGDYTASMLRGARKMLLKRGVSIHHLRSTDLVIMNVWKPTCPVVETYPLALLDPHSVSDGDMHPVSLGYKVTPDPKTKGGRYQPPITMPTHSSHHVWWHYPRMTDNEALVFTQMDGREGFPRQVVHSAFYHPSFEGGAKRSNVEVRAVCLFDKPAEAKL